MFDFKSNLVNILVANMYKSKGIWIEVIVKNQRAFI